MFPLKSYLYLSFNYIIFLQKNKYILLKNIDDFHGNNDKHTISAQKYPSETSFDIEKREKT